MKKPRYLYLMNAWIIYIYLHTDIRKSFIGPL